MIPQKTLSGPGIWPTSLVVEIRSNKCGAEDAFAEDILTLIAIFGSYAEA
jgi:hypothetical protein